MAICGSGRMSERFRIPVPSASGARGARARPTSPRRPPPAVALDFPDNVETSDRQDNSITVAWDAVDDADEYEVQQREDGGDWVDANCGSATGSNAVTDTSCVASGLDEDTEYDFRVKAFPDSSDSTKTESGWSRTASATTTGEAPPPPITGGGDALNAQWTSMDGSITWNWDPVLNRADRDRIDHLVQIVNDDARCGDITQVPDVGTTNTFAYLANTTAGDATTGGSEGWQNIDKNISTTYRAVPAGGVATLCVVRTWTDELASGLTVQRFGTPEVVTASTAPTAPSPPGSGSPANNTVERKTTSLSWTFMVDKGLEYEVRLLVDSRNVSGISDTKDSCDAGDTRQSPAISSTDNVTVTHRESSSLKSYYQYGLCVRAKNAQGVSGWSVTASRQNTLPGKPSPPRYQPPPVSQLDNHASGSQIVERLVWSVAEMDGTPRSSDDYTYAIVRSEESSVRSTDINTVCQASHSDYVNITAGRGAMDASAGIEVRVADENTSDGDLIGAGTGVPDDYYFFACVRAEPDATGGQTGAGDDDHGPWAISSGQRFSRKLATPGNFTAAKNDSNNDDTDDQVVFKWNRVTGATGYSVYSHEGTNAPTSAEITTAQGSSAVCSTGDSGTVLTCIGPIPNSRTYYWVVATTTVAGGSLTSGPSTSRRRIDP